MKLLLIALLFPAQVWALGMIPQLATTHPLLYEEAGRSLNPDAYYRLDDQSGTTTTEDNGLHDGTYRNTPTLNASSVIEGNGSAVTFALATSEDALLPDNPALDLGATHTIVAWFSTVDTTNNKALVGRLNSFNQGGYYLAIIGASDVLFHTTKPGAGGAVSLIGTTVVTGGEAFMTAATLSGGTGRLYVNGVQENSGAMPVPSSTVATQPTIACRGDAQFFFDGTIDEVAIWKGTALTAAQLAMLNRAGFGQQVFQGDYISP